MSLVSCMCNDKRPSFVPHIMGGSGSSNGGSHDSTCKCPKCSQTVDKVADAAQAEHLSASEGVVFGCTDSDYAYANNTYGAPGSDFKDWITAQSVDPQVIKNHSEFIADRLNTVGTNITGRTYSPDSHDSYDPISWIGIRGRPQAVPTSDNQAQVPDVDYNLYSKTQKLRW